MPPNRPRRHSLSSGDESFHPHPARADDLPKFDNRRRARLPRSKSVSNVFDSYNRPPGTASHDLSNVALEQADITTIRELARLFRTTGPPPDRPVTHDECLRFPSSGDSRRWSLQSLRRTKRSKFQRHSVQSHPLGNTVPGTTSDGRRYISISTPAPKNVPFGGPWFRSQYPVFLPESPSPEPRPHSSPKAWPERSSSKAAILTNAVSGSTSSDTRIPPRLPSRSSDNDYPSQTRVSERARSGTLSNRISTDYMLKAMLNPAGDVLEEDLGSSLKKLSLQQVPGMENTQPQMPPLVAVDEETEQSDAPRRANTNRVVSSRRPSPHEKRKPSPPASPVNRGLQRSPGRSPRPLANIPVSADLAVPKDNMPPESPGFPNMLATMMFPHPPKGSQPSSPASTITSFADGQASPGSRPGIQPQVSSRRIGGSSSVSGVSLDEIVMHKRPSPRRAKSDKPVHFYNAPDPTTVAPESLSGAHPPTAHIEYSASSGDVMVSNADKDSIIRSELTSLSHADSRAGYSAAYRDSQRESLVSQLTATTESSPHSVSPYTSSRSSLASEVSAQSESTITPRKTSISLTTCPTHITESAMEQHIAGAAKFDADADDRDGTDVGDEDKSEVCKQPSEPRRSRLCLSTASDPKSEAGPPPKSIIERRLARKAKVREYKMRDLDASRVDTVDSPVLGYFPTNLPPATSTDSPRRPSTLSMATTISEASNTEVPQNDETIVSADLGPEASCISDPSQRESVTGTSPSPSVQLTFSTVVTTDIEPIYPRIADWRTSGITMSPIMVVADVESRPGSPTLRFSSMARPESASPRTTGRLKPLKISPHSRQKSHTVTISRNPSTGAIERSASGPSDPRFQRRSLITMPTPPMSPEVTLLSKRLSLPPVQLHLPVAPRNRTPPLRRHEWPLHDDERGPESRVRSETLKERVMQEKLQKDKEITDIVAKTMGPPQKHSTPDDEINHLPLEQNNAETLEKRLERLEKNNNAWLCAMKPLLETMARTLDDMRADDRGSSLRMSDFVVDMEYETNGAAHSRAGERATTPAMLTGIGGTESWGINTKNGLGSFSSTPLSPVPQELDDSVDLVSLMTPMTSMVPTGGSPAGESALSTTFQDAVESTNTANP